MRRIKCLLLFLFKYLQHLEDLAWFSEPSRKVELIPLLTHVLQHRIKYDDRYATVLANGIANIMKLFVSL